MSAVLDALEDAFNFVIEAIEDLVVAAWDSVVEPILEQVFAIFGITCVDGDIDTDLSISAPQALRPVSEHAFRDHPCHDQ